MTKLKCPFCQQELECCGAYIYGTKKLGCANCGLSGDSKLFEELERTKKALDKAISWLNEIVENHRFTPISTAEMALKEITALTKGGDNE